MSSVGSETAMSLAAEVTSAGCMYPPIHPMAVPRSRAASPTGMLPGSLMSVKKPMRMTMSTGKAIQRASHIWAAGRIEMKAIETPASVPSIAAWGVYLRMYGPTNAPASTMSPMTKHHASPEAQAFIGSFVARYTGSMIRNVTMNMCGTLGPYGIAVTSVRFSRRASRRAR